MQENKSLVEEALIQMKNVEEAIAENAKGILHSTMKEEISQLVKESLTEQEEEELDVDIEGDDEPSISGDSDVLDSEELEDLEDLEGSEDFKSDDDSLDISFDDVDSSEPIDLTHIDDDEVLLKVFKKMGKDDGIIIKKDGEDIHLSDDSSDSEYILKMNESMEEEVYEDEMSNEEMHEDEMSDDEMNKIIHDIFGETYEESNESNDDEIVYEIEFDESEDLEEADDLEESEDLEEADDLEESEDLEEADDIEESEDLEEADDLEESEDLEESDDVNESYNHKKSKKSEAKEGKMMSKPKGVGIGKPKFSYKSSKKGGFSEDKKEAPKSVGTGKASFKYKDGENLDGDMKPVKKKMETKEAARTYFGGSKDGSRGLRKGVTPNRNFKYGSGNVQESLESEVRLLREKNEEYRKALNVFRDKLTEVAVFNSNLAYATRLFTEHSTTKKEKMNILSRFDGVESLKESKNLYKTIKDELTKTETKSINESVGNKIVNNVSTGSSTTLIESKTYENPQFLRIKDLISKLN